MYIQAMRSRKIAVFKFPYKMDTYEVGDEFVKNLEHKKSQQTPKTFFEAITYNVRLHPLNTCNSFIQMHGITKAMRCDSANAMNTIVKDALHPYVRC